MEYMINPARVGGRVKAVNDNTAEIHLQGKLGVITVKREVILAEREIQPEDEVEFYFSYIQAVERPENYNTSGITIYHEEAPSLIGGILMKVNDTAVEVAIMDDLGTITVSRGWIITSVDLEVGRQVEFYFSCMSIK